MATQLQIRRGTSSQVAAFTGAEGEVVVNTTNESLHVHNGSLAGGFELARVDGSNWAITNNISTTANISFGDNDKAIFGAGSDLQIYHNGTESFIREVGEGGLKIDTNGPDITFRVNATETALVATSNGAVTAYYDNAQKFATTSTGIDVTGTATVSAATPSIVLSETDRTDENTQLLNASGDFRIRTRSDDGATNTDRFRIDHATGDISFYNSAGTSQSLFWDSSAESLGIGTSSPDEQMHLHGGSSATRLRISGGALDETYGGFIEGEGVSGQGGHLRLGVVDNGTDRVAIEIEEQGNQIVFDTAGTERMRIDSSGNVGINVSSSLDQKLNMADTADVGIKMTKTGSITTTMRAVGGALAFGVDGGAGTTERMRIDSSGRVGIGTSSPDSLLTIDKNVSTAYSSTDDSAQRSNTNTLLLKNEDGTANSFAQIAFDLAGANQSIARIVGINDGTSTSALAFVTEGNNTKREAMRLDGSGHITSLPTYGNGSASSANMVVNSSGLFLRSVSSAKYKTNIEDVQDAYVDSLLNIRPVYYRSTLENDNPEHSHWGFIAEEVAEIDPRLVHYKTVDITYSDDGERVETKLETPEPEGVQYDRFAPLMLKLIQKQQATITALEARIEQLENN